RGDLLACGSEPSGTAHEVWKIKINALNSTPADGTATKLFSAQQGANVCDGVTWDASNGTIYMSPDVSSTIYHYSETGTLLLPNLPSPNLGGVEGGVCSNSGLAIVGGTLFIGCDGQLKRFQLDKLTGAVIREFPGSGRTEDLECDPATFAPKGAMWTTDGNLAASLQISAFEIPPSTCGLQTGPTVLNPGACLTIVTDEGGVPRGVPDPTNTADTDGDGLLDCWEEKGPGSTWDILPPHDGLPGIDFDGDGVRDLVLCVTNVNGNVECADKNVKDVFVEFDTMTGQPANVAALTHVVTAFLNAPMNNSTPTDSGPRGVRLHIQLDDNNLTYADNTAFVPCTPAAGTGDASFDALKLAKFGTQAERDLAEPQKSKTLAAKRLAFRYGLGVHNLTRPPGTTSPSGCAEVPGNDFIVALGSFGTGNGTTDEYAGTFMHELGHTLGLRHGGGDNINCKPNYLSVMSYSRQFKNVITDRP